jgi:putative colanic acid biosynthesis acetyltransferase WcaF
MKYIDTISLNDKIKRKIWFAFYLLFFRPLSGILFIRLRSQILRIFGAKIGKNTNIYSSVFIQSPWNLIIGDNSTIGPYVKTHIGQILIGNNVTVSQYTYLCTGSHDFNNNMLYITKPITIKDHVWIGADSFIMMGVTLNKGSIVGARSSVFKNVNEFSIVAGNPAKHIKFRNTF